ncbi:hypothetical protein H0E87_015032 [Populus deltoides]|uniref:Uncharacterized protein n=1 Tax=Populus deltoides TaxID=3696 RepID=A0A8T2Y3I4_POPDE|nr:hypothetical protein H0E87_015032 [Populus deltoides]
MFFLCGWLGIGFVGPRIWKLIIGGVEFNIIVEGTSMSCPLLVELLLCYEMHTCIGPADFATKSLVTTTHNLDNFDKNIKALANGEESSPFIHGGLIDPSGTLNRPYRHGHKVTIFHSFGLSSCDSYEHIQGQHVWELTGLHKKEC